MANSPDTIRFIAAQLGDLDIRTRTMFDEHGISCDEKVVGFICDDTLFITPSDTAHAMSSSAAQLASSTVAAFRSDPATGNPHPLGSPMDVASPTSLLPVL